MVPGTASNVGATAVVNCEGLTNVTFCGAPFHVRVELARKFDPLMPNVNPPLPAAPVFGEMEAMAGTGFCAGGGGDDEPPPQEDNRMDMQQGRQRGNNRRALAIAIRIPQSIWILRILWVPVRITRK
jgi:hypothetical protein